MLVWRPIGQTQKAVESGDFEAGRSGALAANSMRFLVIHSLLLAAQPPAPIRHNMESSIEQVAAKCSKQLGKLCPTTSLFAPCFGADRSLPTSPHRHLPTLHPRQPAKPRGMRNLQNRAIPLRRFCRSFTQRNQEPLRSSSHRVRQVSRTVLVQGRCRAGKGLHSEVEGSLVLYREGQARNRR